MSLIQTSKILRFSGFFGAVAAAIVVVLTTGDAVTAGGLIAASLSAMPNPSP